MPTRNTGEGCLIRSVPLIDRPAARAALARVSRIDVSNRHASAQRLIGDEGAKLPERPIMQAVAIFAAGRNPRANMRQFFQRNTAQGAFSIDHNSLRYHVVGMFLKPLLLARHFLETAFCRLGTVALKPLAAFCKLPSRSLDFITSIELAVAIGGKRYNSKIDPKPIARFEAFSFRDVARAGEKPFSAHKAQVDLTLTEGEQITLLVTGNELEFYPAFNRPDRNRIVSLEAKDTVIIGLCSKGSKDRSNITIDLECVGNLGNASHGGLRGQSEVSAYLGIGQLMEVKLSQNASIEALCGKRGASVVTAFERRFENSGMLARRQEFDGGDKLHSSNIERFAVIARARLAASAIPPRPEGRGFSRRSR